MIREGALQLPFRYAAGRAASRFLGALRDAGRILAARCAACARVTCPARAWCPGCGEVVAALVEVGPAGTLVSFTEVPGRGIFGLVRLDGADGALLHRILGPAAGLAAGTRVWPRFAAARTGSILDLEGFAPGEAP